jgi:hypothetical protein
VRQLRDDGHAVVWALPGHDAGADDGDFDRELVLVDGRWAVVAR